MLPAPVLHCTGIGAGWWFHYSLGFIPVSATHCTRTGTGTVQKSLVIAKHKKVGLARLAVAAGCRLSRGSLRPRLLAAMPASPSRSTETLLFELQPSPALNLEELFIQLDTDSSGKISRKELEQAMKSMYGKPLEAKVIDKMMADADDDGDGEVSLSEFKTMMRACEKAREQSKKLEKTMGLWFSIRERGLMRSKEQKASEDMRQKRLASRAKREALIQRNLDEMIGQLPKGAAASVMPASLPPPSPTRMPANSGLAQSKQPVPSSPMQQKARRVTHTRRRDADPEAGMVAQETSDLVDERDCFTRVWHSMPTPGEFAMVAIEFIDSYAPLLVALLLPALALARWVGNQLRAHQADADVAAPPPPPTEPDWMHVAEDSFYQLAQARPGAYLVLDLGIAFALGALALFWKDITDWLERRRMQGYQPLDGEAEEAGEAEEKAIVSVQALRMELYKATNVVEEVRQRPSLGTLPTHPA